MPAVQTRIVREALSSIEDKADADISVGRAYVLPFNTVVVKDALLLDRSPVRDAMFAPQDTILHASTLVVTFGKDILRGTPLHLRRVSAEGVELNLVFEGNGRINLTRALGLGRGSGKTGEKSIPDLFRMGRLNARGVTYRQFNVRLDTALQGRINFMDMEVKVPLLKARDFNFVKEGVSAEVTQLHASEKCGYNIRSLTGKVRVVKGGTFITDLHAEDDWSDVNLDEFSMSYANGRAFKQFLSQVSMHGSVRKSRLDGRTICVFTRRLEFGPCIDIETAVYDGPVSDMRISRLAFSDKSGVEGNLSCRITGINRPSGASVSADVQRLSFRTADLSSLLSECGIRADLSRYAKGERLSMSLKGGGPLNSMRLAARLTSGGMGEAECDLSVNGLMSGAPEIAGRVTTRDLDVASAIGKGPVRECSAHMSGRVSFAGDPVTVTADTLYVGRLNILGYDYQGLAAAGTFSGSEFDGRVICSDPNLNFLFQGIFTLSEKTSNALYKFYFNLGYADLHALNIDKRPVSRVSGSINANYMSLADGKLVGDVDVGKVVLESPSGRHDIGDISLSSHSSEGGHTVTFSSGFASGTIVSDSNPLRAVEIIRDAALRDALPVLCGTGAEPARGNIAADFTFADTKELLAFFRPGVYIADGTTVNVDVDGSGGMDASVRSQRIAIMDKYAKDIEIRSDKQGGGLNLNVSCGEVNAGLAKLQSPVLSAKALDDRVEANFRFDGDSTGLGAGDINIFAMLSRDADDALAISGGTAPSTFSADGNVWNIGDSRISWSRGDVSIEGLEISSGSQAVLADGVLSRSREDTLAVELSGMDLSMLTPAAGMEVEGLLSGSLRLLSPMSGVPKLNGTLESGGSSIAGRDMGRLMIDSEWDAEDECLSLSLRNEIGSRSTISADARVSSDRRIDAAATFDGFDLGYFADVQTGVYSDLQGSVSGSVTASGPMDALSVRSSGLNLDAMMQVGFTEVKYWFKGAVEMDDSAITLKDISVNDGNGGRGVLSGGLRHDRFSDIRTDITARFGGLRLLDIASEHNESFYGKVSGDGVMRIEGPLKDLRLSVDANTAGGGDIYIPLKSGSSSATTLLTFREPEKWVDPYERMMEELSAKASSPGNFDISLHVVPNPEVACHLEIDGSAGNAIVAKGNGDLDIDINARKKLFNFNGDYNITEGNFHYSVIGIASRDFSISNGSNIKFEGDIMNSSLDINASYTTKVSLSTLIADTTSTSTRRNVICGINVSDRIRNPQLKFSIDIPDLDPVTESQVRSALNTEDKLQRQFLSLLVANTFLPEDRSGISNNSNILFSNVSEIMAGQLNNILSRLNIPLDLGLKYQPSEEGEDMFDVAVSTRLFDNRVTVNGNLSNNQNSVNRESGDVAGDLDIGIKLDKAGAVQLSLFSHSADLYSNYLDNLQRNGVGIGYSKEFRKVREFWRDLFSSRKERRQRAMQEAALRGRAERVTIEIQTQ